MWHRGRGQRDPRGKYEGTRLCDGQVRHHHGKVCEDPMVEDSAEASVASKELDPMAIASRDPMVRMQMHYGQCGSKAYFEPV